MTSHAREIAGAARALQSELALRVALYADALAQSLATELDLVAWDREQLIGALQVRLRTLAAPGSRITMPEGPAEGVRVVERRHQPLESIDLAWKSLLAGHRVFVEHEPDACGAAIELLRGMSRSFRDRLGAGVLTISNESRTGPLLKPSASASAFRIALESDDPLSWREIGPFDAPPRIAAVTANADRELAAYVLARTSLRRTGTDPRSVKLAYVEGPVARLHRHTVRLWLGAMMGPATDASSFAGPVSARVEQDFLEAQEAWSSHPDVETWCSGGVLDRGVTPGRYLAPALFSTTWPDPTLPVAGPMLVIVRCSGAELSTRVDAADRAGTRVMAIGPKTDVTWRRAKHVLGAVLVERLPPGLPEPRPV